MLNKIVDYWLIGKRIIFDYLFQTNRLQNWLIKRKFIVIVTNRIKKFEINE
jgi:hypothetical protein